MQIPRRKSDELKVRDTGPIYLTPQGIQNLKDRLARLKSDLPHLINETQRTAAYGDRSENAEYKDAKGNLRRANGQILNIQDQLKRAVPIDSGKNKTGTVQIGSIVIVEINGAKKTFEVVGHFETDPAKGRISNQSPLGAALLNHKERDIITIKTPKGTQEYHIIEIQ